MTQNPSGTAYVYGEGVRNDVLRMIPPDGHVIGSIGCGKGATEAILVGQGREVHGVDVAPEAIVVARERLTSARLIAPDDRRPFAPNSLDGLILADVLEHIPRAWEALGQFVQAVRPGGWVVISVPNMRYWNAAWRFVVQGDWPEEQVGIFDSSHVQVMTHRRLERWCRSTGLQIIRWFDQRYDGTCPTLARFRLLADLITFRVFHSWFQYQIEVLCRRVAVSPISPDCSTEKGS